MDADAEDADDERAVDVGAASRDVVDKTAAADGVVVVLLDGECLIGLFTGRDEQRSFRRNLARLF